MANATTNACPPAVENSFGPAVNGCRATFDFTLTFENAFFTIAPSALLLLVGGARLPVLLFRRQKLVKANAIRWCKTATISVFAVLQLALVLLRATHRSLPAHAIAIAAAALSFVASVVLCVLSPLEHSRSLTPSAILCSYLFFTLLFDATLLRTLWLSPFDVQIRGLATASFSLKVVILILEAKEKRRFVTSQDDATKSPEEFAGVFGKSLYWWLNPIIRTGYNTILNPDTLYTLPADIQASDLDKQFWYGWNASRNAGKHKLSLVLLRVLRWRILAPVLPKLVNLAFTFAQPLLLQRFLRYLQDPHDRAKANVGYGLIGAYFLVYLGMAISSAVYWLLTWRSLTVLRSMLLTAIYKKTTTIAMTSIDNGKAMTLMGTDAERIIRGVMDFHELWSSIIQVGIASWLLERQLGVAAIGPVTVCVVAVAATVYAGTITNNRQRGWIEAIEERIGMTSSVLGAMRAIRLSGLTTKVETMLHGLRLNEIKQARRFWLVGAYSSTIALVPQMLSPVASFAIFVAISVRRGESLDFSRMFTSLALLILLTQPLFNLFAGLIDFVAAIGCFERINNYLAAASRVDSRKLIVNDGARVEISDLAISIRNGSFSWRKDENDQHTLQNLDLSISNSTLTCLIGPVASGKSTLLKAILGELPMFSGEISVLSKEIAFCDQTPWLFNASIRENICAFSDFQPAYYHKVVRACALEPDFKELQNGDETTVGSKGFSLSSGQKQRIALARAVYSRKTIMLFDDVLSQLDGPTQRHIVSHLFGPGGLLREPSIAVLLATHAVSHLPFADNIVVLDAHGAILEQGTYRDLRTRREGYVHKLSRDHNSNDHSPADASSEINETLKIVNTGEKQSTQESAKRSTKTTTISSKDRARMRGDFGVYVYYLSCLGPALAFIFFFLQFLFAFFTVFPNIWLKWWADSNTLHPNVDNGKYISGYTGLQIIGLVSSGVMTWFCFNVMAQKAGLQLHTRMLKAIMRAPMSLFSITDTGSIMNRFSQDFQLVDSKLPLALMCVVMNLFIAIGQVGLVASASGWIALSFPFLIAVFYVVQRYYLRTSRQMRLLDLEQKAPLYTQFTESVEGIASLRAFSWGPQCIQKNFALVDNSQRPFYLMYMIQKWLSLVLDLIITALAVLVIGVAVALKDSVSVGFTGVSLSQIISLTSYLKMIILFWTQMETSLGAVSRLRSFSEDAGDENLPEKSEKPPRNWPSRGAVDINNLSVSYRGEKSTHTALRNVTLAIPAGAKVGICGRTGSGKTTLLLSLLKLVDAEGHITIDSIDHGRVSREVLRERIITVSDEAFLFPGRTLRENLDPMGRCADDALLEAALKKAMLWDPLVKRDAGNPLLAPFAPSDLSHGQRQLFALARALVRYEARLPGTAGLVILDEATSQTDKETDVVVQQVIRDGFQHCTLVVIAHRLESLLDFDLIVVLERGEVVEFDKPEVLRMRSGSKFRQMLGEEKGFSVES